MDSKVFRYFIFNTKSALLFHIKVNLYYRNTKVLCSYIKIPYKYRLYKIKIILNSKNYETFSLKLDLLGSKEGYGLSHVLT